MGEVFANDSTEEANFVPVFMGFAAVLACIAWHRTLARLKTKRVHIAERRARSRLEPPTSRSVELCTLYKRPLAELCVL